jgi:cell division septation protein DedD
MKRSDFKAKHMPHSSGKGVLIVLVVVASSASFLLGYFVGRSIPGAEKPVKSVVAVQSHPSAQAVRETVPPETEVLPPSVPAPGPASPAGDRRETDKVVSDGELQKTATTSKGTVTQTSGTPGSTKDESVQKPEAAMYAVQVGAFKKKVEAEALGERIKKKGYRAIIKPVKSPKGTLYKVMSGRFKSRKEAELLAVKLSKAIGKQAFVVKLTE